MGKEKTLEQKIEVMQAALQGKSIRITLISGTLPVVISRGDSPILNFNWAEFDYEVYEEPKTKPSIDWSHVSPEFKWMATDASGETYLYTEEPEFFEYCWDGVDLIYVQGFASFKEGTCDWKDSLVERPEGE